MELDRWVAGYLADRHATGEPGELVRSVLQADGARVRAHPPLLGQLLDNLLDNAREHGGSETPIVLETTREGRGVILAVEDAGLGIQPEDLPHIFEPFYRSAQARRRGISGVGLGLAVVHRIAVAFGGTVSVRSEPGRGCRFEVRLIAMEPIARIGGEPRSSSFPN